MIFALFSFSFIAELSVILMMEEYGFLSSSAVLIKPLNETLRVLEKRSNVFSFQ